uniref:MYND-type domain-containing protein n=1 Tax=Mycena chlorophos TaxID=658473 RepID=A0ABQ0LL97_MYCCL|nr:predicted protein [Mycena chlorophos]
MDPLPGVGGQQGQDAFLYFIFWRTRRSPAEDTVSTSWCEPRTRHGAGSVRGPTKRTAYGTPESRGWYQRLRALDSAKNKNVSTVVSTRPNHTPFRARIASIVPAASRAGTGPCSAFFVSRGRAHFRATPVEARERSRYECWRGARLPFSACTGPPRQRADASTDSCHRLTVSNGRITTFFSLTAVAVLHASARPFISPRLPTQSRLATQSGRLPHRAYGNRRSRARQSRSRGSSPAAWRLRRCVLAALRMPVNARIWRFVCVSASLGYCTTNNLKPPTRSRDEASFGLVGARDVAVAASHYEPTPEAHVHRPLRAGFLRRRLVTRTPALRVPPRTRSGHGGFLERSLSYSQPSSCWFYTSHCFSLFSFLPLHHLRPPTMNVSNIETGYVEGIENPYTKFTISVPRSNTGTGNASTTNPNQKKHTPADNVFVNNAGDGYGAHSTTFGAIADKIPSRPPLKKPCDNDKCQKWPDQGGSGYAGCSECKVARYCSRECQKSHWKFHKNLCKVLTEDAKNGPEFEAEALRNGPGYVSQAALRKWYYDNVDIVNYAVIQCLELYKGIEHSRWRTHAVLFYLRGGKLGTSVTADEMSFSDAEEIPFSDPTLPEFTAPLIPAFGAGRRIILLFMLYQERDLMLVEDYPLPEPGDSEWAGMEKDEMWRMHIRMRKIARKVVHGEQ